MPEEGQGKDCETFIYLANAALHLRDRVWGQVGMLQAYNRLMI